MEVLHHQVEFLPKSNGLFLDQFSSFLQILKGSGEWREEILLLLDVALAVTGELEEFELRVLVVYSSLHMSNLFAQLVQLGFSVWRAHLVHIHLVHHFFT